MTGGGTGGHVSPALAVVQTLREQAQGSDWTPVFLYVGSAGGVEKRLAEDAGLPFVAVQTGKLRRAAHWRGLLSRQNIVDAGRVPIGVVQSLGVIRRFRPAVVFATGGYVSVPPVLAARLLGVPVLIHEQTVQVGLANRLTAGAATRIALSYDGSEMLLPRAARAKAFVTGNPVRAQVFGGDRARGVARFGLSESDNALPCVYVTGGAQGAQAINCAVSDALPELLQVCRVLHQCGQSDWEDMTARARTLPPNLARRLWLTAFVREEIADAYALADLVVGRSGAGTVAELCALGKPSLLVPLVPTGGDEQTKNARRLAEAGAAALLPGAELSGARLLSEMTGLLNDRARLAAMGQAALALARPDAARDLARAILQLVRQN